jgi:hypothetical protein
MGHLTSSYQDVLSQEESDWDEVWNIRPEICCIERRIKHKAQVKYFPGSTVEDLTD